MISLSYNCTAKNVAVIKVDPKRTFKKQQYWDYYKSNYWEVFLSPELFNQSFETQRNTGAAIYFLLASEVEALKIEDCGDLLHLLEGMLFADYSFNRFLSNKTENKLTGIALPKTISKAQIKQLELTKHAVDWTRDMVNLPVSHLSADAFAEEIKKLCEAPNCTVEILNHKKMERQKHYLV